MATRQNVNLEWLNHNAQRKYPLASIASCRDETDSFQLPNDFVVGIYLPISLALTVDPASFLVRTVAAYGAGFTVTIGYQPSVGSIVPVAAASVPRIGHTQYASYVLRGLGDFYDTVGSITIGEFDDIDNQPAGQWQFDLDGGRLEVDAIRPQLRGVSALRVQNGGSLSDPLTGDIVLQAGRNIRLTPITAVGQDPVVRIDAISGEGLNEDCVCVGDASTSPPIRSINGVPPTADGRFTLVGNDCLRISPIQNGVSLDDVCSKPCCGCTELEAITAQLESFGRQATTLENFIVSLEARVTQMDQVVLGSKLGDRGCANCS